MSEKSWKAWKRQYKSLKEIKDDKRLPESVRLVARLEFESLDKATFTVTLNCILCKENYEWEGVSAAYMAEWLDDPRGVCGPCNARIETNIANAPSIWEEVHPQDEEESITE